MAAERCSAGAVVVVVVVVVALLVNVEVRRAWDGGGWAGAGRAPAPEVRAGRVVGAGGGGGGGACALPPEAAACCRLVGRSFARMSCAYSTHVSSSREGAGGRGPGAGVRAGGAGWAAAAVVVVRGGRGAGAGPAGAREGAPPCTRVVHGEQDGATGSARPLRAGSPAAVQACARMRCVPASPVAPCGGCAPAPVYLAWSAAKEGDICIASKTSSSSSSSFLLRSAASCSRSSCCCCWRVAVALAAGVTPRPATRRRPQSPTHHLRPWQGHLAPCVNVPQAPLTRSLLHGDWACSRLLVRRAPTGGALLLLLLVVLVVIQAHHAKTRQLHPPHTQNCRLSVRPQEQAPPTRGPFHPTSLPVGEGAPRGRGS